MKTRRFVCPKCGRKFRSLQKRWRHIEDAHVPEFPQARHYDGTGYEEDYIGNGIRRRHVEQLEEIQSQ